MLTLILCAVLSADPPKVSPKPATGPKWPPNALAFRASHYAFFDEPVTWAEAKQLCAKKRGHLVVINTQAEWKFFRANFKQKAWVGCTDAHREGDWKWITGTGMPIGKPKGRFGPLPASLDNFEGRQHFLMWNTTEFDDDGAEAKRGYICEWD